MEIIRFQKKFCIRNIAGKVRFYDDNIELINGECIDEIMWQIENKISTKIANGYNAEIVFMKED